MSLLSLARSREIEVKKLDEAILEELERNGPGSRVELTRRLAGRMQPALKRLVDSGAVYRVGNRPDRRVDEKVYSLSPDPIQWPQPGPIIGRKA
jgi:hypothetical protein